MTTKAILLFTALLLGSQVLEAHGFFNQGNSTFLGKVGKWFGNLKERIFGNGMRVFNPPEDVEVLRMTDEEVQQMRFSNPGGFFLDLANLQFNDDDWGFHVGNWLIIRKHEDRHNLGGWEVPREKDVEFQVPNEVDDEAEAEVLEVMETSEKEEIETDE